MLHLALLVPLLLLAPPPAPGSHGVAGPDGALGVSFGLDAQSLEAAARAGVHPAYATLWVGAWTVSSGWGGPGGPDAQLQRIRDAGATPAVHLYYWGDDLSPSCFESGCWSPIHHAHKDRAQWAELQSQVAQHLEARLQGGPALIILETEFNKAEVAGYEPLDEALAAAAQRLRDGYPAAKVVLGFGNWNPDGWATWDRAAQASDLVGVQSLRGLPRDVQATYLSAPAATLQAAQRLHALYGKPVIVHDLALSSFGNAAGTAAQAATLNAFFGDLPALKAAGVEAILYRAWSDNPAADPANHYGDAEAHWGLAKADGLLKPAALVWILGTTARGGFAANPATTA